MCCGHGCNEVFIKSDVSLQAIGRSLVLFLWIWKYLLNPMCHFRLQAVLLFYFYGNGHRPDYFVIVNRPISEAYIGKGQQYNTTKYSFPRRPVSRILMRIQFPFPIMPACSRRRVAFGVALSALAGAMLGLYFLSRDMAPDPTCAECEVIGTFQSDIAQGTVCAPWPRFEVLSSLSLAHLCYAHLCDSCTIFIEPQATRLSLLSSLQRYLYLLAFLPS
jgi:hypothetical protein